MRLHGAFGYEDHQVPLRQAEPLIEALTHHVPGHLLLNGGRRRHQGRSGSVWSPQEYGQVGADGSGISLRDFQEMEELPGFRVEISLPEKDCGQPLAQRQE